MHSTDADTLSRPLRADAQRNRERLIAAARDAFAEHGASTSLEDIARRAGVGIGTLYRNFPNRQTLLEAVYVKEVQEVCRTADDVASLPPWEALAGWLDRVVSYLATKQALANELLDYVDRGAPLFTDCRRALFDAGGPLLERAQSSGVAREDTDIGEVVQIVGAITKIPGLEPGQREHMLRIAIDGLRARP
ncbi:MAG TPA: helix-turn-helix domain-containing protein [Solirubrobacteraceae bacterium]|nr:helix-turn-helix domain-containing protein [Solirubrobacteraceae bacterium]